MSQGVGIPPIHLIKKKLALIILNSFKQTNNKDICFMTNELHKLKQEIADERKEKEILKTRLYIN